MPLDKLLETLLLTIKRLPLIIKSPKDAPEDLNDLAENFLENNNFCSEM